VYVFTEPQDGQYIYDERLIKGTMRVLARENGRPLDESAVGKWLDEIYDGEVAADWQKEFTQTAQEFEEVVVNSLRPFSSADRDFQEKFNKLFDGIEILPIDLHNEYYDFVERGETIEAKRLLVSISWSRFHVLRNKAKIRWDDDLKLHVVDVPYTSELGLDFSGE
jgi:CRISPR-associated endonuclease/helicase Cas3